MSAAERPRVDAPITACQQGWQTHTSCSCSMALKVDGVYFSTSSIEAASHSCLTSSASYNAFQFSVVAARSKVAVALV